MTDEERATAKQAMYRALTALRLEVPATVADDIEAKVLAHVDALEVVTRRLAFQLEVHREMVKALREMVPPDALAHFDGMLA